MSLDNLHQVSVLYLRPPSRVETESPGLLKSWSLVKMTHLYRKLAELDSLRESVGLMNDSPWWQVPLVHPLETSFYTRQGA